ncbi:mechanosensitive ion channel domain-containing protein [Donghicola eburneus]|uniref:Putative secreted protein n=1 Tax=Donghicola eburneus TaxID=393278 RepID=A0A1M4N497_9RHOB|nr:mechanosensitive ion channel domain-containing protein [Donghicola eburneus]SCM69673.1 putative secreted protein [Donghicola eburneus]SFQ63534.1 small conductance mechanosensitive channel [Donghicola eburneus]
MIRPLSTLSKLMLACVVALMLMWSGALLAQDSGAAMSSDTSASDTSSSQSAETDKLIDVLQNDSTRERLIEALREIDNSDSSSDSEGSSDQSETTIADEAAQTVEDITQADDVSFGRQIATFTKGLAEDLTAQSAQIWRQITFSVSTLTSLDSDDASDLLATFKDLALVIVSTIAVFIVLRSFATSYYKRLGAKASDSLFLRSVGLFFLSGAIDVLIVLISWLAGYALALMVFGEFGEIGIRQTLYLNAFLVVELIKVVVRLIFSPATSSLRMFPLNDDTAGYVSRRLNLLIGLLGYGQLLVVPVVNNDMSYMTGRAVTLILALLVLGIIIATVLRNRTNVASYLLGRDEEDAPKGAARVLARNWHWPVLLYLAGVFVIVMTRSTTVVFQTFVNTAQVALVVLIGMMASGWLTHFVRHGVRLPASWKERLPLLESRLNKFVPKVLAGLRVVLFLFVVVFALNALGVFDLGAALASNFGANLSAKTISVILILAVSCLIWLSLTSWVDYRLNPDWGSAPSSRETTLLSLLRNAATIALIIITLMFVLSQIGLDIAPLLASAGVLGLAIGFGAQKMVQDIITGIFIQFEGVINVGDVITLNGTTGVVEKLTIRSVSLRDYQGIYHMIPFSSVDMVSNYMMEYGYFVADMGVAYRESVPEVKEAMFDAFNELKEGENGAKITGDFEWFGLNSFGDSAIVLRGRIKTRPGDQWGIGRAYNEIIKRIFDERGIEIPFPYQTLTWAENKDGSSVPMRVKKENQEIVEGEADDVSDPADARNKPKELDLPDHTDGEAGDDGEDGGR